MQTLIITHSLFVTNGTDRQYAAFSQCYEIACICFNSQYRAGIPQKYFVHWFRDIDIHTPDIASVYEHRFYP